MNIGDHVKILSEQNAIGQILEIWAMEPSYFVAWTDSLGNKRSAIFNSEQLEIVNAK